MNSIKNAVQLQVATHLSRVGLARHALVSAVDPVNHSVKVDLQPEGVTSGWLPDPAIACRGLRIAAPSEVGTQVLVVPVEGDLEHPVIVARLFDTQTVPPTSPATGQPVQPGEVGVFLDGGTFLHMTAGKVVIGGTLEVQGAIVASGDVTAGKISLEGHVHGGVSTGNATTAAPSVTP